METCSVVLTFKSVDEILWCDHSNETSSAVFCMVPNVYGVLKYRVFMIMARGLL